MIPLPKHCLTAIVFSSFLFSSLVQAKSSPGKETQCFACHGANGVSSNPAFPSLAGQNKNYLMTQLKAFKSGDRKSQVMKPMAVGLIDKDMEQVAAYFASKCAIIFVEHVLCAKRDIRGAERICYGSQIYKRDADGHIDRGYLSNLLGESRAE